MTLFPSLGLLRLQMQRGFWGSGRKEGEGSFCCFSAPHLLVCLLPAPRSLPRDWSSLPFLPPPLLPLIAGKPRRLAAMLSGRQTARSRHRGRGPRVPLQVARSAGASPSPQPPGLLAGRLGC